MASSVLAPLPADIQDDEAIAQEIFDTLQDQVKHIPFYVLTGLLANLTEACAGKVSISTHYRAHASMAFSPREVDRLIYEWRKDSEVLPKVTITIYVNFMGLQSTDTPLPLPYHEEVITDVHNDRHNLHDFYNFFSERALRLLMKGLQRSDYVNRCNQSFNDALSQMWLSLVGIFPTIKAAIGVTLQHKLLKSLPWLFGKRKSLTNCAKIIEQHFGFNQVRIASFVERTVELDQRDRLTLGKPGYVLAENSTIGRFKKDYENLCHIHIYVDDPFDFLPKTAGNQELKALIKWLLPTHLLYKVILHTEKGVMPILSEAPLYLGWTTALGKGSGQRPGKQMISV